MNKLLSRALSSLLVLVLICTLLPTAAFAAGDSGVTAETAYCTCTNLDAFATVELSSDNLSETPVLASSLIQSTITSSYDGYTYTYIYAVAGEVSGEDGYKKLFRTGSEFTYLALDEEGYICYGDSASSMTRLKSNEDIVFIYYQDPGLYAQIDLLLTDWGCADSSSLVGYSYKSVTFNLIDEEAPETDAPISTKISYFYPDADVIKGISISPNGNYDYDISKVVVRTDLDTVSTYDPYVTGTSFEASTANVSWYGNLNIDIYVKLRTTNLTINYLEAGTNAELTNPKHLAMAGSFDVYSLFTEGELTTTELSDKFGVSYTIKDSIDDYRFQSAEAVGDDEINVYYSSAERIIIQYNVSPDGAGTLTRTSESLLPDTGVVQGSSVTAAAEGYRFLNWTNAAGTVVSSSASYTPPKAAGTYTANFVEDSYSVTINLHRGNSGSSSAPFDTVVLEDLSWDELSALFTPMRTRPLIF